MGGIRTSIQVLYCPATYPRPAVIEPLPSLRSWHASRELRAGINAWTQHVSMLIAAVGRSFRAES
eukprot:350293-Pyramimonas_sp.AAC.1